MPTVFRIAPARAYTIILAVAWRQRAIIIHRLPESFQERIPNFLHPTSSLGSSSGGAGSRRGYSRLPRFDWGTASGAGLNSSLFDIEANVADGDSRSGLDQRGAEEVHTIMQSQGVVSPLQVMSAWRMADLIDLLLNSPSTKRD